MWPDRRNDPEEPPSVFVDSELGITIQAFLGLFRRERGGVLLGKRSGDRTLVSAAIFPTQQVSSRVACSFGISVIDIVHEALKPFSDSSNARPWSIVGWIHSHPGLEIFLSEQDLQTLRSWTDLDSAAVAMVVDPHSRADRVGVWGQGGRQLDLRFQRGSAQSIDLVDGALLASELRAKCHERPKTFWNVVCSHGVIFVRPSSRDVNGQI